MKLTFSQGLYEPSLPHLENNCLGTGLTSPDRDSSREENTTHQNNGGQSYHKSIPSTHTSLASIPRPNTDHR
jgi:hypothetical protein